MVSLTEATSVEISKAQGVAEEARQEMKKMKSEMEAMKAALEEQKRHTQEMMQKQQQMFDQRSRSISPTPVFPQRSSKFLKI